MTLKELVREAIYGEMGDISACEADAAAFAAVPGWDAVAAFYSELADEKRERLQELRVLLREGVGFRQRRDEPSRSPEASLRARIIRADRAAAVYAGLMKLINKPESKEALKKLAEREKEILARLKELRDGFKK